MSRNVASQLEKNQTGRAPLLLSISGFVWDGSLSSNRDIPSLFRQHLEVVTVSHQMWTADLIHHVWSAISKVILLKTNNPGVKHWRLQSHTSLFDHNPSREVILNLTCWCETNSWSWETVRDLHTHTHTHTMFSIPADWPEITRQQENGVAVIRTF